MMEENRQQINTLQEFANIAVYALPIWRLLVGAKVNKISKHKSNTLQELIWDNSKVHSVRIQDNQIVVGIAFHSREKLIIRDYAIQEFLESYDLVSSLFLSNQVIQKRKSRQQSLLKELDGLLDLYNFDDAEEFYRLECHTYISPEEYQQKKYASLQKIKSPLLEKLQDLFSDFYFDEAEEFYKAKCSQYISTEEYQQKKQIFLRKKKNLLFLELDNFFEQYFLGADEFYQIECVPYISEVEYSQRKQNFCQNWVETNLKNKPDLEQSTAIGSVNSHVQVIARAGSGKTSTLVNRAIFLQKHCGIKPSEILLLAFNKKAVQEIRERLQKHLQNDISYVMTFHALAYHLVHPDETLIFDEPDGQKTRSRSLQSVIDEYLRKPDYFDEIKSLMMKRFRAEWQVIAEEGFNLTPEEMLQYRRALPKMGIDGWSYKSGGEKIIADFLFEHGIPFKYERNFRWNGINYHPDFTVFISGSTNKGVVIEYFGMQGDPEYDELSEQKRRYWQNQSDYFFVELDPQILKQQGRKAMEEHLHQILTEQIGLQFNRLSDQEIWEKIKERAIDSFTKAMTNFIGRCRKQCLTPDQLSEKIDRHNFDPNLEPPEMEFEYFNPNLELAKIEFQFLNLAQDFYGSYLDRLRQTGEEDFDGLMQRAAKVVNNGNTIFLSSKVRGDLRDLKYIMIDEYQDFSLLFHNLVTAIRNHNPQALFFCVGDDWQAINSFAGADLHYYNKFTEIFNPSHTLSITTNYRSGSKIVDSGNKLMSNKGIPARPSTQNQGKVELVDISKFRMTLLEEQEHGSDLTAAVIRLTGKLIQDGKQVVLLNHKNHLQKVDSKISALESFRKYILQKLNLVGEMQELVTISTTHKYKGKERQAVIILDDYNYPSIHPDAIFNRIFGDHTEKLIEDERRLFYVALTRAKEHLFIITDSFRMSPFVEKLTSKIQLDRLNWSEYPVPASEIRFITVKVGNHQGQGTSGTFNIREMLKADGYRWNGNHWCRVKPIQKILPDDSRLQFLRESVWSAQANGIEVTFCDEQDQVLALYRGDKGIWTCVIDKFNELKPDEPNEDNYDDFPF
jgi:DNA helicase IV